MNFFLARKNYPIIVLLLVLVIFGLSLIPAVRDKIRRAAALPAKAFDTPILRLKTAFGVLFAINDLAKENAELRDQLNQKQARVDQLQTVEGENIQLKNDLNFKQTHSQFNLVPANIIGFSPVNYSQSLTINRGSSDDLKLDQAVVAGGYLIGKIKKINPTTAEVWLLSNRNLLTPVMIPSSQTVGILKGSIKGLIVENIPLDTKLNLGDEIVTSSLEGLVPPGIAVGKIEEIISTKEDIFLTLRITTPINISNLSTAFIIK